MSDSIRSHTFQTLTPPRLSIEIPKGRITITAAETAETVITLTAVNGDSAAQTWIAEAQVEQNGDEIVVRNSRGGLLRFGLCGPIEAVVRTPTASNARLANGAGRIETCGRMARVTASTGAGAIRIEGCESAKVHTGSGEIEIGGAAGEVDAKTGAGKIMVGKVGADGRFATGAGSTRVTEVAGAANFTSGSGNIELGQAGESVEAFTASGKVEVRRVDRGRVRARTVSGKVTVGVADGVPALLDINTMNGRVHSDLAPSAAPPDGERSVELILSTVSGNIYVSRASAAAPAFETAV